MNRPGHICLVGTPLCRNWRLVERLGERHGLTLLPRVAAEDVRVMAQADVVAVDCRAGGAAATHELVSELSSVTRAAIVVTDGGLRREDIARLLHAGVMDYFSEPLNVPLIAERLEHLASSNGARR
jgi:response regulator RpfG family c-di-GMP phosphodiesterase